MLTTQPPQSCSPRGFKLVRQSGARTAPLGRAFCNGSRSPGCGDWSSGCTVTDTAAHTASKTGRPPGVAGIFWVVLGGGELWMDGLAPAFILGRNQPVMLTTTFHRKCQLQSMQGRSIKNRCLQRRTRLVLWMWRLGCSLGWESRPWPQAAVCAVSCGTNSLFSSYTRSWHIP